MDDAKPDKLTQTATQPSVSSPDEVDWTGKVLGQFRLLHRIGRGGMGQVYLAEQTSLNRKVALKLLHPELAGNERSLLRFEAEAKNVARATHANIVQIYDIGKDNGINWLALEYVDGRNLRDFIEKKGTPELSLGLHIIAQVASALQRASELGIIHRDIKPENILLTKKGEVKVADFGLSRCFAEEGQQTITQSQVTMGTPLYMSPEQVERKTVDTRTDIYSFGVTCYHMFAGTPPFRGTSPIEVAYQHVHKDPSPLADIRPDLPAELCAIIQKMMAKKPEDRYQTAREIVRDVNALREALNLGGVAVFSISSSFLGSTADNLRGSVTQTWPEATPRSPWLFRSVMIVCVLIALVGGLGAGWFVHHRPQSVIAPPDDPGPLKKPAVAKEDATEKQRQVEKYLNPTGPGEVVTGFTLARDLGLYFLKEKRLEEADQLFLDLGKPERKVVMYRWLGRLGHATVLAFKDEAAASNQEFLAVIDDIERTEARPLAKGKRDFWRENGALREMIAKAIDRNFANALDQFADNQPAAKLNVYRFPPRPTLKAAGP
jgi:eukaryotic-like serine/threonine-protein kinase